VQSGAASGAAGSTAWSPNAVLPVSGPVKGRPPPWGSVIFASTVQSAAEPAWISSGDERNDTQWKPVSAGAAVKEEFSPLAQPALSASA
jgi:hypothetical protein